MSTESGHHAAFPGRSLTDRPVSGMSIADYATIEFIKAQIANEGMEGYDPEVVVKMAKEYTKEFLKQRYT